MRRWLLLVGTALTLSACDDGGGGGGAQDAAVRADQAFECQIGDRRCDGLIIEACGANAMWAPLGPCPAGTECTGAGQCTEVACQPNCVDAECGGDGCGGECGACEGDEQCVSGRCQTPPTRCGDDECNGAETCSTCPADCGQCCGDGACDGANEDCANCPADCACEGEDRCNAQSRMCEGCTPQCAGRDCGDDGCGGDCGECEAGVACGADGLCAVCTPMCDGRACGPDGCGGDCGQCQGGDLCNDAGQCTAPPAQCGDGACDANEDCSTCPADCGQCCGNGRCGAGENCATCPADCGCGDGQVCNAERRQCVDQCVPQCAGRDCGADGCGGDCGQCGANQACEVGVCRDLCVPACDGRECGGDGCGGRCGDCAANEQCDNGQCILPCQPMCEGRDCGSDGCGGDCGRCALGRFCSPEGTCELECVPACDGRACGDDGCGGTCGACAAGEMCTPDGQCEDPGALCQDCAADEICLDGFCRGEDQLCSAANPVGLCPTGQDCLAGVCTNRGNACTPQNQTGVCPLGELCRDGACQPFDGAALCDDDNACTSDRFDQRANRCEHRPVDAACSDGNGCTRNRCEAGVCLADPIAGCIEPPAIDDYTTPTNVGAFVLSGTKPAGSAIEIDGQLAIPESPEQAWEANINLVPGENVFRVRSVDMGTRSAEVVVRVVYDITPPTVSASPAGGVFLNPVSVTVAASEGAEVYYTDDGGTPDRWSKSFRSAKQFRVFHDTTLKFLALDDAGNWQEAAVRYDFEITSEGSRWSAGGALPEPRTLAAAELLGDRLFVVAGTDGQAAQAGVHVYDLGTGEWSNGPALQVARAQLSSEEVDGRLYLIGGEADGLPLNLVQRMRADEMGWENLAPMPSTRFGLATVHRDTRIFALGGKTNGGAVLDVVEVYNIANNNWTNQVAQMPRPRFGHAALEHEGRIYVVGGEDANGTPIAEVDIYDIGADAWVAGPALPTPRSRLTLTKDLNRGNVNGPELGLVAAGGLTAGGQPSAVVEELVIDRNVWRERAPLDAPRHSAAAVHGPRPAEVDGVAQFGWAVGGQRAGQVTDSMIYYTRDQDYLRRLPALPEGRFMATAQEADGLIYVIGGRAFRETQVVWAYDPETGRTIERAQLPQIQNGLASAAIGGLIYAVGGANNFGLAVPWLNVYDPGTDGWRALQPMPTARRDAAVVALDGELWVIGGDNNGPLQTVEIYDPETNTWRAGPVLPDGRAGARAVVHDGQIIVAFGRLAAGPTTTALRYANGRWNAFLQNCQECEAIQDGQMALIHDHQLSVFGGRVGGAISNRLYSVNLINQGETPLVRAPGNLLHGVNWAATVYHHGRVYLLGGNDSAGEPGPGGLTDVQQIKGHCFNGLRDGGETEVDTGAGCPAPYPQECRFYEILSSNGRGEAQPEGSVCDNRVAEVNVWYRLEGNGGTRFVEGRPARYNRCNTDAVGYLTSAHPSEADGVVARNVCYYFINNNCWDDARLQVRNCGEYFVYRFTQLPGSCSAAICTE
ncbi:MAG: chitobiase/beta-hexosaminidase C-terminal domain-containing protein [Myxococcales bacterium]|nr:chitobiase/beta-hexosaminidase C-terminal domain-containing protein [Myxococcales bacterium]